MNRRLETFLKITIVVIIVVAAYIIIPFRELSLKNYVSHRQEMTEEQLNDIKEAFAEFVANQFQKNEKQKLIDLNILGIKGSGGKVEIKYKLNYEEELKEAENVSYSIEATATLSNRNNEAWVISKVDHQNQNLEFKTGSVIKAE